MVVQNKDYYILLVVCVFFLPFTNCEFKAIDFPRPVEEVIPDTF